MNLKKNRNMIIDEVEIQDLEERIEIVKAHMEGKQIQYRSRELKGDWLDCIKPYWVWSEYEYKIKERGLISSFYFPQLKTLIIYKKKNMTKERFKEIKTNLK